MYFTETDTLALLTFECQYPPASFLGALQCLLTNIVAETATTISKSCSRSKTMPSRSARNAKASFARCLARSAWRSKGPAFTRRTAERLGLRVQAQALARVPVPVRRLTVLHRVRHRRLATAAAHTVIRMAIRTGRAHTPTKRVPRPSTNAAFSPSLRRLVLQG